MLLNNKIILVCIAAILVMLSAFLWYLKPSSQPIETSSDHSKQDRQAETQFNQQGIDLKAKTITSMPQKTSTVQNQILAQQHTLAELIERRTQLYVEFQQLTEGLSQGQLPDTQHIELLLSQQQILVKAGVVTQQEGIGFIQYLRQALPEMDRQLDKAQLALEQISSEKGKT